MKIAIDGFRLVDRPYTSIANYIAELTASMAPQGAVEAIALLLPRELDSSFQYAKLLDFPNVYTLSPKRAAEPAARYLATLKWTQSVIPDLMNRLDFDWYIDPYHHAPLRLARRIKVLTVIHDMCGLYPSAGYPWYRKGAYIHLTDYLTSLLRSDTFVFVSKHTEAQFDRLFPWAMGRPSQVILNEVVLSRLTREQTESVLKDLALENHSYFLAFAARERRKGLDLVIPAFKRYHQSGGRYPLALISPSSFVESLEGIIDLEGLSDSVRIFPTVTNHQRDALYGGALALLFPSRCEGFGYPIIEAMAQGCPTIAWENSPAKEILQDTVLLLGSLNPEEIASQLQYYATMASSNREMLATKLQDHSVQFGGATLGRNFVTLMEASTGMKRQLNEKTRYRT